MEGAILDGAVLESAYLTKAPYQSLSRLLDCHLTTLPPY